MNQEQESQSGDFGAFLAGFVIGGLVGAAVALVLAPRSGEEIRAELAKQGEAVRSRGSGYLSQARSGFQTSGSEQTDRVRIVLDDGTSAADAPPETD